MIALTGKTIISSCSSSNSWTSSLGWRLSWINERTTFWVSPGHASPPIVKCTRQPWHDSSLNPSLNPNHAILSPELVWKLRNLAKPSGPGTMIKLNPSLYIYLLHTFSINIGSSFVSCEVHQFSASFRTPNL